MTFNKLYRSKRGGGWGWSLVGWVTDTKKNGPPSTPSMHFYVPSFRSYRFCVGQFRNCMEVIVKIGKNKYELRRKSWEIPYFLVKSRGKNFRLILSQKIPGSRDFAKSRPEIPRTKILNPAGAWSPATTSRCHMANVPRVYLYPHAITLSVLTVDLISFNCGFIC